VLNDPPPPARRAGPLAPLLDRLLAKDPAERPAHDAIRAALAGVSVPGAGHGPPELTTSG
jgi:hypothetical protein